MNQRGGHKCAAAAASENAHTQPRFKVREAVPGAPESNPQAEVRYRS
jgi:hypothetical protein